MESFVSLQEEGYSTLFARTTKFGMKLLWPVLQRNQIRYLAVMHGACLTRLSILCGRGSDPLRNIGGIPVE